VSQFWPFVVIGLTSGSVYGLAGTGLVLTYKTSGIFNFAHGTIAALMAYLFYNLHQRDHVPWPIALIVCVFVLSPLVGYLLERMARRLADAPLVMKVVATVGLLVGLQQFLIIHYGSAEIFSNRFLPTGTFRVAGVNIGYDQAISMVIALAGVIGLTLMFSSTRLGRGMQAVVDQPELLALTGTSPIKVRRRAWYIGTSFAGLCGILLAPTIGLDPLVLTLLVVQAFGAAAIGRFRSIPLTYAGGLLIGVLGALATKYVTQYPSLAGIPPSMPFIVLFVVLVVAPRRWLVDFTTERKPRITEPRRIPLGVRVVGGVALVGLLLRLPYLVGAHLPVYTSALAYVIIFLSLAVLMRTSGQVSLAQLAFAAVGAVASGRLAAQAGVPWFLAVVLGALTAVPIGVLLAIPAIRRSGLYLALATFGFAVLLEQLVYPLGFMFGGSSGTIRAPRPDVAHGDRAYYYVVLAFVVATVALVIALNRSRLGRLLRAMADSPTALDTYGTSVTAVKVIVFSLSAFLAGLGGALYGPVTGTASPDDFAALESLILVVVAVLIGGSEVTASVGAAVAQVVVPGYITSATLKSYLPLLFGVAAVMIAMSESGVRMPARMSQAAARLRPHPERSPIIARLETETERRVA
jgi:branched-subunit amino acid ABC-type transport system permease component